MRIASSSRRTAATTLLAWFALSLAVAMMAPLAHASPWDDLCGVGTTHRIGPGQADATGIPLGVHCPFCLPAWDVPPPQRPLVAALLPRHPAAVPVWTLDRPLADTPRRAHRSRAPPPQA